MITPRIGDRVRYRRPGGKPTIYEGTAVTSRCRDCGPAVVHVHAEGRALHHVPLASVCAVIPADPDLVAACDACSDSLPADERRIGHHPVLCPGCHRKENALWNGPDDGGRS